MRVRARVFYTHDVTIIFCTTYVRCNVHFVRTRTALISYCLAGQLPSFVPCHLLWVSRRSWLLRLKAAMRGRFGSCWTGELPSPKTKWVHGLSFYVYRLLRLSNAVCIVHIQLCDKFHVLKINATFLHCIVRQHGSARGCVERQQRHCEGSAK